MDEAVQGGKAPKYGVMICGHGSRSKSAVTEFAVLAEKLAPMFPDWPVEYGYLEFATPVIKTGLDKLRGQGVTHVLAVPGMLFAAGHAKNDIPSVLNTYASEHGITIQYGRELAVDLQMLQAAGDRISAALAEADAANGPVPRSETCLVVIGRGASDPDANSNISKIARMLWEGMGFGWAEVGYSGVTFPLVQPCLEHVTRLGFKRIVVFPYFLFSGILIDRIYGFTDEVADAHPDIEIIKAGYLNDHPKVIATFADRVREILNGSNNMNCAMCKYRAQVLGFENEVGLPQESHHHHVEGQGVSAPGSNVEDCDLCDHFCTGACRLDAGHSHDRHSHDHSHDHLHDHTHDHDHGHHHHPYPHANHPLGPESVRSRVPTKRGEDS
jgi:sirohydrochlorin cobaltochelatase